FCANDGITEPRRMGTGSNSHWPEQAFLNQIGKSGRPCLGDLPSSFVETFQFGELMESEHSVDLCGPHIEAGIDEEESRIDMRMLRFNRVSILELPRPAMRAQASEQLREVVVLGHDHTAFDCGEVMRDKETDRSDVAVRPDKLSAVPRAEAFARVFDHPQAVLSSQRFDSRIRHGVAQDVHGTDRNSLWADCLFGFIETHLER